MYTRVQAHRDDGRGELGVVERVDQLLVVEDVALRLLEQLEDLRACMEV